MGSQYPYVPRPYDYRGSRIVDLLLRQGDVQAERAARQGEIWGNAINNLGQIAGGAVEAHQQEKQKQTRAKMVNDVLMNWNGKDPQSLYGGLTAAGMDPNDAVKAMTGMASFMDLQQRGQDRQIELDAKQRALRMEKYKLALQGYAALPEMSRREFWATFRNGMVADTTEIFGVPPEQVPEQWTPDGDRMVLRFHAQLNPAKTREIRRRNADGSETIELAEDVPGQTWQSAPEPPKPVNLQQLESADGIRTFNPQTGAVGPVIAQPKPPAPRERMWVVRDGKPIRISESEYRPGDLPASSREQARPATGAEKKVFGFYLRGKEALDTIEAKADSGVSLEDEMASSLRNQAQLATGRAWLQSDAQQRYQQAQRAFTEARLRKESGAAVPQAEYDADAKTYFVQPGDGPAVVKQKRESRQKILDGLKYESGRAFDEFFGESNGVAPTGPQFPNTGPNPRIDPEVQRRLDRLQNMGRK